MQFKRLRLLPDILFKSDHLSQNLAKKSVKGGLTTTTSAAAQLVISTISSVILARLLTPADYGLFGMVTVITGFATMFKNAGLSTATIQSEKITHEQISSLFWINILISLGIGFILAMASPLIALFYGKPELTGVTIALSISFIISGLTIQHEALLYRHMHFSALVIIDIMTILLSATFSIILARLNFGYWALVGGSLVGTLSTTLLDFYFCPWIPGRLQKMINMRRLVTFGGHLTVSNIANYFSSNMDNFLIGKFIGADALGLYSRAYQLFLLPISRFRAPLVNVALPVLSSLHNQPERYVKYFTRIILILGVVTTPISVFCVLESDSIIRILFGTKWLEAAPIFQILALGGIIYPFNGMQALAAMSMGFSKRLMIWGVSSGIIYVIAFIAGLAIGAKGVAIGFTIATTIIAIFSLFYCLHGTPISPLNFLSAQIPPLLICLIAAIGVLVTEQLWPGFSLIRTGAILLIFFSIYVVLSFLNKSIREAATLILKEVFHK